MSIYIFDTETTDRENGEIIEAAWLKLSTEAIVGEPKVLDEWSGRFLPSRPSTFGAMAVHNILPFELEGCPPSSSFELPEDTVLLIGHSIDFDWNAAGSPDNVRRIDTCSIAKWLWPDASGYSQIALLYMLDGATPETRETVRNAHGALADARMNYRLLKHILAQKPEISTWNALWRYSEECRIPRTCPFKRWEGVLLEEMDYSAITWCLRQDFIDPYFRTGLNRVLEQRGALAY
jgi:exodeoxyribonuclease X